MNGHVLSLKRKMFGSSGRLSMGSHGSLGDWIRHHCTAKRGSRVQMNGRGGKRSDTGTGKVEMSELSSLPQEHPARVRGARKSSSLRISNDAFDALSAMEMQR